MNKAMLIGNVGKDPEIRKTSGGISVVNFTLATSERYKDKNGQYQTLTEWHNIVAWSGLAEIIGDWVKKGSRIFVEGKIQHRVWEDNDGGKHTLDEIRAENIELLDRKELGSGKEMEAGRREARQRNAPAKNELEPQPGDFPF